MSLREFLGLSDDLSWEDIRKELDEIGLGGKFMEQLPNGLESRIAPETWKAVDADLRFALGLFAVLRSKARWIMLEEAGLSLFGSEAGSIFLRRLSDRIAVIVYGKNISVAGSHDEDVMAVIDASRNSTVGLGSVAWLKGHQEEIEHLLRMSSAVGSEGDPAVLDAEDEIDIDEM
jgi:hypothetical protein